MSDVKEDKGNQILGKALSDGSPCLQHGCVLCCTDTQMPLTENEIRRLEKLGNRRHDFSIIVNGETRLRNKEGLCFFLREDRCAIYLLRPEGCTIYPLVYDVDVHKFVFDGVCPNFREFHATRKDKDQLRQLLRKLDKETAKKTN